MVLLTCPMLTRFFILFLRIGSLSLFVLSGWLTYRQFETFKVVRERYPKGLSAAGIPIGGLTRDEAAARLESAYNTPVELLYQGSALQLYPTQVSFRIDLDSMLEGADRERLPYSSQVAFWGFLRGEPYTSSISIPLNYSLSSDLVRQFLVSVVVHRYDLPPQEARPYPGLPVYVPGAVGHALDVPAASILVEGALLSLTDRVVDLPVIDLPALPPAVENLEVQLKQIIELAGYEGLLGFYMQDLGTGQEIHISLEHRRSIPTQPDVPFTASSVIKIPVMVSVLARLEGEENPETAARLERMIGHSDNTSTDWLVRNAIDPVYGPLFVTEDIRKLGLENTFLAGYFERGSPLLQRYDTPANRRQDINISLDPYNQTSPSEMGRLLAWIYICAKDGSGPLPNTFSKINQEECSRMIDYLVLDKIPFLLQAGVPEGTTVAHKHGWVASASTGIIHDISDAAILFTPGGDYVLSVFLYHPQQLLFEPNNLLIAELSRAVYNFFNPPQ